jgi:hypothetical protein
MNKGNQAPQKAKGGKILRSLLLLLLLAFVAIQFFQPDKNNQSLDMTHDIATVVTVPDSVHSLLKTACYDCHSNNTNYPWYANIQPIGWWLKDHIDEGKSHLNFQEFALVEPRPNSKYNTRVLRQDHKLEEVYEQIDTGEMPLKSYTLIHGEAELNASQAKMIMDWVGNARTELIRDSLVAPVSKL